ncbi:MAG: RidA family protein [Cyanobacteria bacterium P01_G01_bin.38]
MIYFKRRQVVTTGAIAAAGLTMAHEKAIGVDDTMPVERKNYPHLDAPVGPYVHGVAYNGLLFLSGLTAFNTPAQDQDLPTQADAVFNQLGSILEAEGTGFENLLKVTIFVTEFGEIDKFRDVLFSTYQDNLPASSLIQVRQLFSPDLKIEVDAIAAFMPND